MLTVKEVAAKLGVSPSTVYRWVDDGDLNAVRLIKPSPITPKRRRGGAIRIPEAQVNALLLQTEDAA